jgi:putative ATP-dependent endonuclease of OLD family
VHLTRLAISNHRRLADLDLEVRRHLVLIGANDVGKSSLLRCADLLLGQSTAQLYHRIVPEDFRDPSQPFAVEVRLAGLTSHDEKLFPDEISVDPGTGGKSLTIRLEASLADDQSLTVERWAPDGGTGRQLSRDQVAGIGWRMLGALALSRDLREDRRSLLDEVFQSIELGGEKAGFEALTTRLQDLLTSSTVLETLRDQLASHLSRAMPYPLGKNDLAFRPGSAVEEDVLSDVRLHINRGGHLRSMTEQSDGTRALFAIAMYDLVSVGANMVGVDEPEIHLHPTSQRSLAHLLQDSQNQKLIATHSADIVSAFDPECVVSVRPGGTPVQPAAGFLSSEERLSVEWWMRDRLEPLTARHVAAVEGISDRIILVRAAEVTNRALDRLGASVIETGGSGNMGAILKLFGKSGFDVPLSVLIDKDAEQDTANKLGVAVADLEANGVTVSDPDLEAEYVAALGGSVVWGSINASSLFSPGERANCAATGTGGTRTDADVAAFCRHKKYKVKAAMVAAGILTDATARSMTGINKVLDRIEIL